MYSVGAMVLKYEYFQVLKDLFKDITYLEIPYLKQWTSISVHKNNNKLILKIQF